MFSHENQELVSAYRNGDYVSTPVRKRFRRYDDIVHNQVEEYYHPAPEATYEQARNAKGFKTLIGEEVAARDRAAKNRAARYLQRNL